MFLPLYLPVQIINRIKFLDFLCLVLQCSDGGSGQEIFGFKTPKRKDALVNAGLVYYFYFSNLKLG